MSENHFKHSLFVIAGLFIAGCSHRVAQESQTVQSSQPSVAQQNPLNVIEASDDEQWIMATKDYANRRYSSLDQINPANVNQLKLAWSFSTGVVRGHEAPTTQARSVGMDHALRRASHRITITFRSSRLIGSWT